MDIHGSIKSIGRVEKPTENFSKVGVILDTSTYEQVTCRKFENYAKLQFCNDKINLLSDYTTGQRVRIYFNIKGGERTNADGKTYFNQNLNAYKIERL